MKRALSFVALVSLLAALPARAENWGANYRLGLEVDQASAWLPPGTDQSGRLVYWLHYHETGGLLLKFLFMMFAAPVAPMKVIETDCGYLADRHLVRCKDYVVHEPTKEEWDNYHKEETNFPATVRAIADAQLPIDLNLWVPVHGAGGIGFDMSWHVVRRHMLGLPLVDFRFGVGDQFYWFDGTTAAGVFLTPTGAAGVYGARSYSMANDDYSYSAVLGMVAQATAYPTSWLGLYLEADPVLWDFRKDEPGAFASPTLLRGGVRLLLPHLQLGVHYTTTTFARDGALGGEVAFAF